MNGPKQYKLADMDDCLMWIARRMREVDKQGRVDREIAWKEIMAKLQEWGY